MNKPVAWMNDTHDVVCLVEKKVYGDLYADYTIPLYTHPVKELTDEEINDIAQECWVYPKGEQAIFNQHKFAKAILRKAQEK